MTQELALKPVRPAVDVFIKCPLCGSADYQLVLVHEECGNVVRCSQCYLKYARNRWMSEALQSPKPVADAIMQKEEDQTDDFQDIIKTIRRYQPSGKLLELGSLTGHFLALARDAGYEPTGIEPDPVAAGYARRQFDLNVHETVIPQLHLEDSSFDVIAMFHVMEHLTEPMETLVHLRRILTDAGVLAIEIPIMDTLVPLIMGRRHRHYCWDHTLFMSRAKALEFLQKAGFKVLHTELTGRRIRLKRLAARLGESYDSVGQFLEGAFKTLHIEERIVHLNARDNYRIYCRKAFN
jgi:SAM-dependent methyltransferase